jgi:hypothetical protein
MTIPEMTHPLGKHWEQPDKSEIKFSFGVAWVSEATFKKLASYDVTFPSGVYEGKMWRRKYSVRSGVGGFIDKHLLMWYDKSDKEGHCDVKCIDLMIDKK